MQVKIDTKEKFQVITPQEKVLSATMADEMKIILLPYFRNEIKNLVVNLKNLEDIDIEAARQLLQIQQEFYENNASFVVCSIQKSIEKLLDENELLALLNVTPTESEAWDIVQMEEIERELMNGE